MNEKVFNELLENNKHRWFVEHIDKHLPEHDKVICKICGKGVDEIGKETLEEILKELKE